MISTGLFTLHRFPIQVQQNEPVVLYAFGDVHRDSPLCSTYEWQRFLAQAEREKAYLLGMGDYIDFASTGERKRLSQAELHETTLHTFEDVADRRVAQLAEELRPFEGRIVSLLEGNHYFAYGSGITSTQKLCEELKCHYAGASAFIRLALHRNKNSKGGSVCDVWAHHGRGASRFLGGSLNRVQQMQEQADASIFAMGHDHKRSVGSNAKLCLSQGGGGLRLIHRRQVFVRTGSFLKGFERDTVSYAADGAMSPNDIGPVRLELTLCRDQREGNDYQEVEVKATL